MCSLELGYGTACDIDVVLLAGAMIALVVLFALINAK